MVVGNAHLVILRIQYMSTCTKVHTQAFNFEHSSVGCCPTKQDCIDCI